MNDLVSVAINRAFANEKTCNSIENIPDNAFGVFVTVKRHHRLTKWPEDIHGCIGRWDENFKIVTKENMLNYIKEVGHSATHSDSRKDYFKEHLVFDLKSMYVITFMLSPIMPIDSNGIVKKINKLFDNNIYGIIVQSDNNSRATYLPGVFPDITWEQLKSSLIQKAGIKSNNIKFYAYNTIIYENSILDELLFPPIQFMNEFYGKIIPYEYKNKVVHYDETSYVRNISSMMCLLEMQELDRRYKLSESLMEKIRKNIKEHYSMFESKEEGIRQSLPFLIMAMYLLDLKVEIKSVTDFLVGQLENIKETDKQFEYGEVLCGLTFIGGLTKNDEIIEIVLSEQSYIYNENIDNIEIFQLNWYVQFIAMLHRMKLGSAKNIMDHAVIMSKKVLKLSKSYDDKSESNYLAVSFEALTGLYSIIMNDEHMSDVKREIDRLFNIIFKKRNNYGLIEFSDGSARIDITCHFISGIFHICRKSAEHSQESQKGGMYPKYYVNNKNKYIKLL